MANISEKKHLKIIIHNFKSIRETTIDLHQGISILIGPNGSGKTCVLSSMKFLKDVFRVGAAQALALQGGAKRAYHHGQNTMKYSISQSYGERTYRRRKYPCILKWEMSIAQSGPENIATIINEHLEIMIDSADTKVKLFELTVQREGNNKTKINKNLCNHNEFGRDLFSQWEQEFDRRSKVTIFEQFTQKILPPLFERLKSEQDRSFFPLFSALDNTIRDTFVCFLFLNEYNILPDIARTSTEQLPFAWMSPNGGAVSEVVDALQNSRFNKLTQPVTNEYDDPYGRNPFLIRHPYYYPNRYYHRFGYREDPITAYRNALENINKELSAAVKPITHVSVDIDPTNGKRYVVFMAGKERFLPQEVSDGTVKWLCILVSLFVPFSRVYFLEEPENFLHPWMQQRLIAIMREQAQKNGTVFLLSSHSATILNAANPEELCIVQQSSNGTNVSTIEDIETIRKVLSDSDFHLGDLWVSGAVGGVPSDE